jgi:hypothetical protein
MTAAQLGSGAFYRGRGLELQLAAVSLVASHQPGSYGLQHGGGRYPVGICRPNAEVLYFCDDLR